jgi:hypothetical protein
MTSKRIKRIERRQGYAAARGRETEDERQRQQPHGMRRGQQQQAGLDGQREPGIATALPDRQPGMQQEHRPERTREDQRAEFDAGRAEGRDRHGQQHGDHRLRAADDGTAELIDRTEGEDGADLRQQIHAEDMIAGGPEGDIGQPERQRRTHMGADLIFPAIGQHGGEIARRPAIQQQGDDEPDRGLTQHDDPEHQPWPGADQFDDQGGETH